MNTHTDSTRLGIAAVVVAAILFVAVNLLANGWLGHLRADFTEERSYTTSDQIKPLFENISEQIVVRLYYSDGIGRVSQRHGLYYQRVRDLLQQYANLSKDKIKVELYNPEPFSDVEDRAVGFGLQGLSIAQNGEVGYFGLAATNSTDDQQVIPFFNLDREQFLEYDLTKLIYSLSNPNQPKIGLITSLPVSGGVDPMQMQMGRAAQTPPWAIMEQIREFFTVEPLNADITEVPKGIDMLLLIQPENLTPQAQLAIDQFVLGGGKAMVFIDPKTESVGMGAMGMPQGSNIEGITKLLTAWGVKPDDKIVGDVDSAMRINMGQGGRPMVMDYVAWMQVGPDHFDSSDAVTGDLKRITMGTAGALDIVEGAGTKVSPLIVTGLRSQRIAADKFIALPDVAALFREFKPANKRENLAVRITGTAKSAFPDAPLKESKQPIQVLVVADTDMLTDRFWTEGGNFMGQQVVVPTADNGSFVVNAIENLTGAPALSSLRGRGVQSRPFTLINSIRRDAEMQYRAKEQSLTSHLEELEKKVKDMQVREDGNGAVVLSPQDQKAIESYRSDMLATRRELREVQRALRESIDHIERLLTFVNVAAVPIVFGLVLIITSIVRRRRARRAVEA